MSGERTDGDHLTRHQRDENVIKMVPSAPLFSRFCNKIPMVEALPHMPIECTASLDKTADEPRASVLMIYILALVLALAEPQV